MTCPSSISRATKMHTPKIMSLCLLSLCILSIKHHRGRHWITAILSCHPVTTFPGGSRHYLNVQFVVLSHVMALRLYLDMVHVQSNVVDCLVS